MLDVTDDAELIDTQTVADLLGKSVPTINRWAAEERLKPAVRGRGDRGYRLYRRSDIEALRDAEVAS